MIGNLASLAAMTGALTLFGLNDPAFAATDLPTAFSVGGIEFLGDGPGAVTLGAGGFNVLPNNEQGDTTAELRLEYRFGEKWHAIGPMVGALVTSEGELFAYVAAYADLRVGERWIVTPAAGIGAYEESGGKDLGGVFQFHLGLDLAYRLDTGARLGLKLAHISNAGIHESNPGTESLLLTYTQPLGSFNP